MIKPLENWKNMLKFPNFLIGTCFLILLLLMLFLEEPIPSGVQLVFGLVFLLFLGGFFMYVFTPQIVDSVRDLLMTANRRILPPLVVFIIFSIYRIIVPTSTDPFVTLFQILVCFIFLLTPTFLYISFHKRIENGLSYIDVIAGLWVWLPIEFGVVDTMLGTVELGNLPFDTLLALFAFFYALIFVRHHDMGLSFTISREDLMVVILAVGILTLIIAPLGMLSYFLAPPAVIIENVMILFEEFPGSIVEIILTFLLIFLGTALIEELFFRGFFFRLLEERFKQDTFSINWWYGGIAGLVGLIIITPWIDDILQIFSWIPMVTPLQDIIGFLAEPLGDAEGQAWPLVESIPLEALYLVASIILGLIAIIMIYKTKDPLIAALVLSSILFGWAHFEDIRYIFFASIAGFAYGWTYWKTQKIVPAALVHTTVNTIWGILFSF
ncbi:MAG: CPBP family intramembrane metalloprotease [Candidatus Heimdallarchaeota archaeon]|nr:MAG: CPBP family intramembrane metalloprotease [Candidatus Heimdallarchaeota archaeon]